MASTDQVVYGFSKTEKWYTRRTKQRAEEPSTDFCYFSTEWHWSSNWFTRFIIMVVPLKKKGQQIQIDGLTNGWTDGWMDGWVRRYYGFVSIKHHKIELCIQLSMKRILQKAENSILSISFSYVCIKITLLQRHNGINATMSSKQNWSQTNERTERMKRGKKKMKWNDQICIINNERYTTNSRKMNASGQR